MKERTQRVQFRDFTTLSPEDRERAERAKVNGKVINILRVLMNHRLLAPGMGSFRGLHFIRSPDALATRPRVCDPAHRMAQSGALRI